MSQFYFSKALILDCEFLITWVYFIQRFLDENEKKSSEVNTTYKYMI